VYDATFATLTPVERRDLAALVEGLAWYEASELLGLPWDAIKRAKAGQPILRTTAEKIRQHLAPKEAA
jgi:hypothetical protein